VMKKEAPPKMQGATKKRPIKKEAPIKYKGL
jgi:hypothetical protein